MVVVVPIRVLCKIHYAYGIIIRRSCSSEVRVRFAPSPTGQLHIGGYRTALYNYLFAKKNSGKFILRLEDTDQSRIVPGAADLMEKTLNWGHIYPDESPLTGGKYGPYKQSERLHHYHQAVNKLLESGNAYKCFCTEKRLDLLRKEAARNRINNKYDGRCRHLSPSEIESKVSNRMPYTIRLKLDPKCTGIFQDVIFGSTQHNPFENEGDPIILKSDGFPTYHLANVVDDHLMGITHVFRGVEWQISTPKHILLYQALGWNPPEFGHLPVILNSDGTKLSKRQGDVHLEHYREVGYLPEAILNFVTSTGGGFSLPSPSAEQDGSNKLFKMCELTKFFDIHNLRTNSSQLDFDNLNRTNRAAIKQRLSSNEDHFDLEYNAREHLEREFGKMQSITNEDIKRVLQIGSDRINKLSDLALNDDFNYVWKRPPAETLSHAFEGLLPLGANDDFTKTSIILKEVVDLIEQNSDFKLANKSIRQLAKTSQMSYPKIMHCVRTFLIGRSQGPPIIDIISQLGQDEAIIRLKLGLKNCCTSPIIGNEID